MKVVGNPERGELSSPATGQKVARLQGKQGNLWWRRPDLWGGDYARPESTFSPLSSYRLEHAFLGREGPARP